MVYNADMEILQGFAPVFDENSRILVLGSFPSVKSRRTEFYYGNNRNRFWHVMQQAFGGSIQTKEDKISLCLSNGIALWDIVQSCTAKGSLDSSLRNVSLVDLSLLNGCPLQKILCNGALAYKLTVKAYGGSVPVFKMPSTSPANVRFDGQVWIRALTGKE